MDLPPSNDSRPQERMSVGNVGFIIFVSYEMRCASELDSKNFLAHDAMICFFLKEGLPTGRASHNVAAGNCAEAVSILVAGAVHCRSGCSRERSHTGFAPGFSAQSCAAGESSHPVARRRLCEFECLPRVSSRKLRELARIFSSHHDAGSNATEFAA